MDNPNQLRSVINKIIREKFESNNSKYFLNEVSDFSKSNEFEKHIDNELLKFQNEFKKIAIENKHPYVRFYLKEAIRNLEETIRAGKYQALGLDELYL